MVTRERYVAKRKEPWYDGNHFAIFRQRYQGQEWPRVWRARWKTVECIDTFPTLEAAERALELLQDTVKRSGAA